MMTRPTKVIARATPATMVSDDEDEGDGRQQSADQEEEQLVPGLPVERSPPERAREPAQLLDAGLGDHDHPVLASDPHLHTHPCVLDVRLHHASRRTIRAVPTARTTTA